MPHSYLHGHPWSTWSREERLFCAVLYEHARQEPAQFAAWLIESAQLDLSPAGEWDLGYEVCLYRDVLWQKRGKTAWESGLSPKRTFDLCLFGETSIIVIEAKVCEGFTTKQLEEFRLDADRIRSLPGFEELDVRLVALASNRYLENARETTLAAFRGSVSWKQVSESYSDPLLKQAEEMYGRERGALLGLGL